MQKMIISLLRREGAEDTMTGFVRIISEQNLFLKEKNAKTLYPSKVKCVPYV